MILIMGASSGLGAAIAKQYSADHQPIFISGRNPERLADTASACHQQYLLGSKSVDLSNAQSVSLLFDELPITPTCIIFSAGSGCFGPLDTQKPDDIAAVIENNLLSACLFLREVVKRYQDLAINVVVVMSTAAQVPKPEESTYCAVKWGVKGLLESLRLELKAKPIRFTAVYPGGMDTAFWINSAKTIDTSSFMTADEAASMLKGALMQTEHGCISDITINRR
ncbi:SDR family NAD(P)-dependent oxidoreductase [Shewanella aestuarii]|uniref:SDR family NAD(P)-dependent oxidoreductase n=1 Tax=Shewanella aestuarii TaxID=1028752 RepID=A0A6G9QLX0_9GAMM|nr:SDR family NAD(P)-dependent oxidoreductase [Shewanella aestuarii]QIR15584.1 SDR family NAD(P)-dependent oxidoreductase [Shewanella aestuarii]